MNFLGHFYLSQNDPELVVGNFIADHIKGKKYLDYPSGISRGIMMHRNIDHFTDSHEQVRNGRKRLFGKYRHYSGVIIDMYYDHFLANFWSDYSDDDLSSFANQVYDTIEEYWHHLPPRSQYMFPYMKSGNWLLRYATMEGIGQSLTGMSRRLNNNSRLEQAVQQLDEFYYEFEIEFRNFFEEIKNHFSQTSAG